MPSGKTHLIVATAASLALTCELGLPIEYTVAGMIGGIVPDSDHRSTTIGAVLPLWLFCRHRTFTHSIFGMLIFCGCVLFVSREIPVALCFGIGYLSHLLLDSLTPMGVMWRWPNRKRYSIRRWK